MKGRPDTTAMLSAELERATEHYRLEIICYENDVDGRDALIRDMYDVAARGEFDVGEEANFVERMRELGIEVDE